VVLVGMKETKENETLSPASCYISTLVVP
jgi:hypothetical protein